MSVYDLNKLMRDVNRNAELARRCSPRIDAIFGSYDLAAEERAALRGWDIRAACDGCESVFAVRRMDGDPERRRRLHWRSSSALNSRRENTARQPRINGCGND
jgi:hypothetical protein